MAKKEKLKYRFERKRIKIEKKLPSLCRDYKPKESTGNCEKADFCKNATYGGFQEKKGGVCYGGTKMEEREDRKERSRIV